MHTRLPPRDAFRSGSDTDAYQIAVITDTDRVQRLDSTLAGLEEHAALTLLLADEVAARVLSSERCGRLYSCEIHAADRVQGESLARRFDVAYCKTDHPVGHALAMLLEKSGVRCVNRARAGRLADHRMLTMTRVAKAGGCVPSFTFCNPADIPYRKAVWKNRKEGDGKKPYIVGPKEGHSAAPAGPQFYQRYIQSRWEYKIYCIGTDYFYYRQRPQLIEPDKHKTREPIAPDERLRRAARTVQDATGLEVASIDFLYSAAEDRYYCTDVNARPGIRHIESGPKRLGRYLLERARGECGV